MKILAYGASLKNNFGGPSILYGVYEIWNSKIPDLEIVYIDSVRPGEDFFGTNNIPLKIIPHPKKRRRKWLPVLLLYKLFGRFVLSRADQELLEEFLSADAVIDLWGINFSDKLGMPRSRMILFYNNMYHLTARLLKKKFIKYTSSFGPILTPQTRRAATFFLGQRTDLILCRERHSQKVLEELGLRTPLLVCPDSALAMKPEPVPESCLPEIFRRNKPVISISVSYQIIRQWKSDEAYLDIMVRLIQFLIGEFSSTILLIPNEIGLPYDDLSVAEDIYALCAQKDSIHILAVEHLSAPQLKYIISRCEMMLASRYHSVAASLSMGIPTVVIGWHHKYEELLSLYGQVNYLLDCESCSIDEILRAIKQVWNTRTEIRQEIASHSEEIRKELDKGTCALLDILKSSSKDNL